MGKLRDELRKVLFEYVHTEEENHEQYGVFWQATLKQPQILLNGSELFHKETKYADFYKQVFDRYKLLKRAGTSHLGQPGTARSDDGDLTEFTFHIPGIKFQNVYWDTYLHYGDVYGHVYLKLECYRLNDILKFQEDMMPFDFEEFAAEPLNSRKWFWAELAQLESFLHQRNPLVELRHFGSKMLREIQQEEDNRSAVPAKNDNGVGSLAAVAAKNDNGAGSLAEEVARRAQQISDSWQDPELKNVPSQPKENLSSGNTFVNSTSRIFKLQPPAIVENLTTSTNFPLKVPIAAATGKTVYHSPQAAGAPSAGRDPDPGLKVGNQAQQVAAAHKARPIDKFYIDGDIDSIRKHLNTLTIQEVNELIAQVKGLPPSEKITNIMEMLNKRAVTEQRRDLRFESVDA